MKSLALITLATLAATAAEPTAREVMEEVQRRSFSKTFRYDGRIRVIKGDGSK
ncbi:MAG: hypothetical protein HY821_23100 [Acidobacteria bacterium]|nr:hypothetical protein [Acidobacteriota bacterium]